MASSDFLSRALGGTDLSRSVKDVVAGVSSQIASAQLSAISSATQSIKTATQTSSGNSSAASTVGNIVTDILGSGLGIGSLIAGLFGLFGGGSSTPVPLVTYAAPASMDFEGAVSRSAGTAQWVKNQGAQSTTTSGAATQQITVQVNAMDSKSFLDHSQEIAQAVRTAMLNSHSLNDVVSDL